MQLTTTAVGFLLLSAGLGICGWQFLQVYAKSTKEEKSSRIRFLITHHFIAFTVQNGLMGLGILFFAKNQALLPYVVLLGSVVVVWPALVGIYSAYYIFSPRLSPYPLMGFASLVALFLTVYGLWYPPSVSLTVNKAMDLGLDWQLSLGTFYLLAMSIGTNAYIFLRLARVTMDKKTRRFASVIGVLGVAGVLNVFTRLVLLSSASMDIRSHSFDTGLALIGLVFITALLIAPPIWRWLRGAL